MKLNKATRAKLYKATKPIWITWPAKAPDPHPGRTYRVALKEQKSFGILVKETRERGTKALVKIHDDPSPILHGLKGTRNEFGDYAPEPEPMALSPRAELQAQQNSAVLASEQQRRHKVHRLELKRAEAIKLNKPGRVKVLTTRIERYRLDAA